MNTAARRFLWITLLIVIVLGAIFILVYGYMGLCYSLEYVYRELFMDIGTPYDYLTLAERNLAASPNPYIFSDDPSQEQAVQEAFQSNLAIKDLDVFLEETGTQAFLVIRDDTILYERYFGGNKRDAIVTSFSVAKSFDSALIGMAIEDGFIHSVDDPITEYLPELAERDARFTDIQIRHLLMMSSGLRFNTDRPIGFGDDNLTYGFNDLRHLALTETQVVEKPETTFIYNNYNPLLLGMIIERATGKSVTAYLQEKLWTPLGMEYDGSWSLDSEKSGFEKMESGINGRAIDFAKFGRLYLHGGNWNGEQIIPAEWVEESTTDNGMIQDAPIFYGFMWWGQRCNPESNDFLATGNFGQYIYVSPSSDLVIVRNGEEYGVEAQEAEWVGWSDLFCQFTKAMPK